MSLPHLPLGRTGLQVSEFALGTWRFGHPDAEGAVELDLTAEQCARLAGE